jgi:hypothetical protein
MFRRASTLIVLTLTSLTLAACSSPTAPTTRSALKAPSAPAPIVCSGGWISSTGYC